MVHVDTVSDSSDRPRGLRHRRHLACESGRGLQRAGRRERLPTGTAVAGGSYSGSPAGRTTTVSASFLTEGMNTIRVCVTDLAGKTGSATTSVEKDTTAPVVVIDTLSDSLLGPADSGHPGDLARRRAHHLQRARLRRRDLGSGLRCGNGGQRGNLMSRAPTPHVTAVSAGSLLETLDAIRICAV